MRSIGAIGIALAISIAGLGATEPAVAKVPKGCRTQQQANQTGECEGIIIENLNRGVSSTGHFYRTNSQKARKHRRGTR